MPARLQATVAIDDILVTGESIVEGNVVREHYACPVLNYGDSST